MLFSNIQSVFFRRAFIVLFICTLTTVSHSQFLRNFRSKPTTFQGGWNIIDDNRNSYQDLLSFKSWYSNAFPGKFSAMKTLTGRLKGELNVGFSKMKQSYYKERYVYPGIFTCVDLNFRVQYNLFNRFFDNLYIPRRGNSFGNRLSNDGINIAPVFGLGFTSRTQTVFDRAMTFNFGFVGTYWFVRNKVGITIQSVGKLGLQTPFLKTGSNYIHHSAGIVYVSRGNLYYRSQRYRKAGRRTQNRVRL
jgi:hypothetical protein